MSLNSADVLESLLQVNYFPTQKKSKEELPPIFSTSSFTANIAKALLSFKLRSNGYDQVEYKGTRYNNVHRTYSIPHPMPYSNLAHECSNNWTKLEHICDNEKSLITPRKHNDGRLIIMDYESSFLRSKRKIGRLTNKKFIAHTDISTCYLSMYSHAIPWALVGHDEAKKYHKDKTKWYNKIDAAHRLTRRNETIGMAIGPVTSNILCEVILAKVDGQLKKYDYLRYIDDYTCYCNTYEEAESFIQNLSRELSRYNLTLNIKKTSISKLPIPLNEDWVSQLNLRNPQGENIHWSQVVSFLDFAMSLDKGARESSIIKYAAKTLQNRIHEKYQPLYLDYLFYLARHYPIIIPVINNTLENVKMKNASYDCHDRLISLLNDSISNQRSDSIAWLLYYGDKYNYRLPEDTVDQIISSGDCVPLVTLSRNKTHRSKVVDFANTIISRGDNYELDRYWLLLYQLFFSGEINNPYSQQEDKKVFGKLKSESVTFIP